MRAGQLLQTPLLNHLIISTGERLSLRTWLKLQGQGIKGPEAL